MCIKMHAFRRVFLAIPIAGPMYKFSRQQLSLDAGDAQVKQVLRNVIYPIAAVPGDI